ncbi:MAG: hypothetical protein ABI398_03815 [Devosia sp.]
MDSFKTIAVPSNPGARRGKRAVATLVAAPAVEAASAAPGRRQPVKSVLAQPTHRYHVSERLRMAQGGYSVVRAGAFCQVTALLPYEGKGALLYRVRSETEQFERVVAEGDLSRKLDDA